MGMATSTAMMAKGLLTWIPGIQAAFYDRRAAHGTGSAAYCYGVWIKHLTLLAANGMDRVPRSVLELGPGESIGTGVAALLAGAERYVAIDAVPHMRPEANLAVFRELVTLFTTRAPRPRAGFPPIDQHLDHRLFPAAVLDEAHLERTLAPARVARIEQAVRDIGRPDPEAMIRYCTWSMPQPVAPGSLDLVFSHVVLNHVEDLEGAYADCARWLRPGGWMSHQVDFTCLGTAAAWNGHRAYGDLAWKVIRGRRPYFVNREPVATHVELLQRAGFRVVRVLRGRKEGGIGRHELAPRWQGISDEDLATRTGFFIVQRR
jgi:SAM-dependent methyltransferase